MKTAVTPQTLTFAQARERVLGSQAPLEPVTLPLARAAGRALRHAVVAKHPLPLFRNSAMDGWAVRAADLAGAAPDRPRSLPVVGVLPAGRPPERALGPGESMRIMTGAPLPDGADAVVPFEHGERGGGAAAASMTTRYAPEVGENVREAGADLCAGDRVLEEGCELSAHDVGLLAALGISELPLSPSPRVAILSTGDELLDPSEPLRPGAIRDSNLPMLALLAREAGADVSIGDRLGDDPVRVAARIEEALSMADVVLTIGGVSAGDFDPVRTALDSLGEIELWRVGMRPGRPQAFGRPRGRVFYGLPGNPASVACVFEAMVRPLLRRMQGFARLDRPRVPVRLGREVASRAGRTDFVRCTLEWRLGALWATPAGEQVSGHLAPQARAHALVIVPDETELLRESDEAEAWLLRPPPDPGAPIRA